MSKNKNLFSVTRNHPSYHCLSGVFCQVVEETVLSILIIHCWAIFAQVIWPRNNKAQTLTFEVIFIFKEPDWYILPFTSDSSPVIDWLAKTERGRDEASLLCKGYWCEREKGLGLRWEAEAFVSKAEKISLTGIKSDHGEFVDELKQKGKSKAVKIKPKRKRKKELWELVIT